MTLLVAAVPLSRAEIPEVSVADVIGEDEDLPVPPVPFDLDTAFAQIRDPAIETVDEQTRGAAPGSGRNASPGDESFGSAVQRRWSQIQDPAIKTVDQQTYSKDKKDKEKEWYERINIRGYTQFRINSVLWNDDSQAPPYHPADRSLGPFGQFFIRRCRIIFSGDLSEHLYFYIQPDFASSVPGGPRRQHQLHAAPRLLRRRLSDGEQGQPRARGALEGSLRLGQHAVELQSYPARSQRPDQQRDQR